MPTQTPPPNWFHFVNSKNWYHDISTLDTLRRKDVFYEPSVLEAMIQYIDNEDKLNIFLKALTNAVDDTYRTYKGIADSTGPTDFTLEQKVYCLIQAMRRAEQDAAGMKTIVAQAKAEEDMAKNIWAELTAAVETLVKSCDLNGNVFDDGTQVTIVKNPGRYVPKYEPNPNDDGFAEIEPFVKVKYSWDIMKLKEALNEGVITKQWLDAHGIDFVRDERVKVVS